MYFAKDASLAVRYTTARDLDFRSQWPSRAFTVSRCLALAELVNLPSEFVYNGKRKRKCTDILKKRAKHLDELEKNVLVVDRIDWIMWYGPRCLAYATPELK